MIENIIHEKRILAIILRKTYYSEGIQFFTPNDYAQQLAYMNRPEGYIITPHIHNIIKREVYITQEVLIIKTGKVRVDFYDDNQIYLKSLILEQGDIILLASGGHGFEMLESTEIIEIKQGPYAGEDDKRRFTGVQIKKTII